MRQTIYAALSAAAEKFPEKLAILGPGRRAASHRELIEEIQRNMKTLNGLGVVPERRVAMVLPNGPEATVCCLAVACCAIAAPLNPALTPTQFEESFRAIRPNALIVEQGSGSSSIELAESIGIPVIRLISADGVAGRFHLEGTLRVAAESRTVAEPDDVALLMQTSGSTSRPKLAPLTHVNVCSGARNNIEQLALADQDRCLCITGLFFTQGILVSVFSSLAAGGSVVCTPGYDPVDFFRWLDEFHPTWYAAPTAIQRSILSRAPFHADAVDRSNLRVIRCSSAPAGAGLIREIENLFRAPMLDSYGLTETSSTIAGERLPPKERKPGSVGLPIGCEIRIVGPLGTFLPPNQIGDVVVRGPNVIARYEAEPEVNENSFMNGWLRTGDLGKIDQDGYLYLTGRSKELINRGGEKIVPIVIDQALTDHPAVFDAVAFAIPDEKLGEEIGAAVVLRKEYRQKIGLETELREFVVRRFGASHAPRRIVFLPELPKTANGKTLRIGLAAKLGIENSRTASERYSLDAGKIDQPLPRGIVEMLLLEIFEDLLKRKPLGVNDDFFESGGDSLLSVRLLARIEETFRAKITPAALADSATVIGLSRWLAQSPLHGYDFGPSAVIPVRINGSLPPLFIVGLQPLYRPLLQRLPPDLPVYGLSFPDTTTLPVPFRIEDIAERQVRSMRRSHPHGPYSIAGWCADGILAFEMARQLRSQGQKVTVVVLIDAFHPVYRRDAGRWSSRFGRVRYHLKTLAQLDLRSSLTYPAKGLETLRKILRQSVWRMFYRPKLLAGRRIDNQLRIPEQILRLAQRHYCPEFCDAPVLLFRASSRPKGTFADAAEGWSLVAKDTTVVDVPGNHREMFLAPNVNVMAQTLERVLTRVDLSSG